MCRFNVAGSTSHFYTSTASDCAYLKGLEIYNSTSDPARLFPEYIAAVEQLARTVDAWRV